VGTDPSQKVGETDLKNNHTSSSSSRPLQIPEVNISMTDTTSSKPENRGQEESSRVSRRSISGTFENHLATIVLSWSVKDRERWGKP
jgi:hypothetical protein